MFMSVPQLLSPGWHWQDLAAGQELVTHGRTITEYDLMNFITATGMTEVIFTDQTHHGAMPGRVVPGALTYTLMEGLLVQGMLQGTGLALLEISQKLLAPVRVGDTIHALVSINEIVPTSRHGRAVVHSTVSVLNQDGVMVMTYDAKRLLAGRAAV
ncbi:acyl dehydratase [Alicycliphilus denitrificans]|uniref:Acyl dehydratase n=2 Tax=Alicycliphilus denitrificans TaxID=179636 RepID=A0A420KAB0_9BURK|nr:acyl dehydratase [Alicycliphilus denitrificans]